MNEKQLELKLCPIGIELLQEENTVDKSRAGVNTVFHYCEPNDLRASYAGCLHTLEAIAEGKGHILRPDCQAAYENGTCAAVGMRKQELKAKRALFFVDYKELTRRRGIVWQEATDTSVIQFRKKRPDRKFVPTQVEPMEVEKPTRKKKVAESETEEIQTNIMEQVLKKQVENDRKN